MISGNFSAFNLNPSTWKNITAISELILPSQNILYVLHDNKQVINVFHPVLGLVDDIVIDFDNPRRTADNIFSRDARVDAVQIIDKNSLAEYYTTVHNSDLSESDTDIYVSYIYNLLHDFPGVDIYYRGHGYTDIFESLRHHVCCNFPEDCTIVLCIFDEGRVFFDAIIGFRRHKLEMITSFDHFKTIGFTDEITIEDSLIVTDISRQLFGDPVYVFFLEKGDLACKAKGVFGYE